MAKDAPKNAVPGTRDPILKALNMLKLFMEEPLRHFGVRETATEMGLSPSNAHRLLNAIAANGFIVRDAGPTFSLSPETIRLANIVISRVPVQNIAHRHLRALSKACNEAVFFGTYDPDRLQIFFSTHIESTQDLRYVVRTNEWVPVYAGASGLAVMAFLPEEKRQSIIRQTKLKALTSNTISDPKALENFLTHIRQAGYAFTNGHRINGAVGIAAPVFDAQKQVIGSISLSIPVHRFDESRLDQIAAEVVTSAARVTNDLGGTMAPLEISQGLDMGKAPRRRRLASRETI